MQRRCRRIASVTLVVALVVHSGSSWWSPAGAAEPEGAAPGQQDIHRRRQALSKKLLFLNTLVRDSERTRKIEVGDNPEAKDLLTAAREHAERARSQMEAGDLEPAERSIDMGLRAIGVAFRALSGGGDHGRTPRERYEELGNRIASFRQAFAQVVMSKGAEAAKFLDRPRLDALMEQGESAAQEKRYDDAIEPLAEAAGMLERALSKALEKETLYYRREFASPEEEFAFELERNRNYQTLVDMLIAQSPPGRGGRILLMQRLLEKAQDLRDRAQARLAEGDTAKALELIEQSTQNLRKALRMGGLAV